MKVYMLRFWRKHCAFLLVEITIDSLFRAQILWKVSFCMIEHIGQKVD